MSAKLFSTPQDCEAAFYEALEKSDLEAMMAVWAEDEDILCVHPGGPRVSGHAAVREVWRQLFASGAQLSVYVGGVLATQTMMMATHSVHEFISLKGDPRPTHPVVATNVYIRAGNGWRMIVHHASTTAQPSVQAEAAPAPRPKTLH